jgi:hypothetical protein
MILSGFYKSIYNHLKRKRGDRISLIGFTLTERELLLGDRGSACYC